MKRTLLLMTTALLAAATVRAQSVTYNHDAPKRNQITVMETGTGALTPEFYYTLLHRKYKKSAAAKNKLSFRTLAGVNLYNQTDEAEEIDSALDRLERYFDLIIPSGGTPDDRARWTEYYRIYQCALTATREAYMPNAQRKKEYLRIYEDVAKQNEILIGYLARRRNATRTETLLNATAGRTLDKGSIVRDAVSRWNELRFAASGSQSGGNGDTGEGDETVNRN